MFKPLDSVILLSILLNNQHLDKSFNQPKGIKTNTTVNSIITIDKMYDLNKTLESILIKENE